MIPKDETFVDTTFTHGDTYSDEITETFYGRSYAIKNDRSSFVRRTGAEFDKLRDSLDNRVAGTLTLDMAKVAATADKEYVYPISPEQRTDLALASSKGVTLRFLAESVLRYAPRAPDAILLQAATELGLWLIRQPGEASKTNMLVRSGAATILSPYRNRRI